MPRVDKEGPLHRSILAYLRTQFPLAIVHHSPNEVPLQGTNVARAIAKAKYNGMVVGFPDLICLLPNGETLFFEVKHGKTPASDTQRAVLSRLSDMGFRNAVVRSIDDVNQCLEQWGLTR